MENLNDNNLNEQGGFNNEQKSGIKESENEQINTAPAANLSVGPTQMSSISVLFQKALEIYKFNFWKFMGLMLLPVLCTFALGAVIGIFGIFGIFSIDSIGSTLSILMIVIMLLFLIGLIFVSIVAQASMLILVRDSEKNLSFKELLMEGKKYAVDLFVVKFFVGLLVLLWMLLFIIPGLIMGIYYSLVGWVLIYEGLTGFKAIKRSKELVKDYWWAVFGRLLAVWGGYYLLTIIPAVLELEVLSFLVSILSFAIAPFFVVYSCFIYWDLVRIKGGHTS